MKLLENLMKSCDARPAIMHPWIDEENRQCICDGYVAFRFTDHLPLHERPQDAPQPIDLGKIFPADMSDAMAFPLPAIADVKSFRKNIAAMNKASGKRNVALVKFTDGAKAFWFDAKYIEIVMTCLPDASEIFIHDNLKPAQVNASNGQAIILPFRVVNEPDEFLEVVRENDASAETPKAEAKSYPQCYRDKHSGELVIGKENMLAKYHADYETQGSTTGMHFEWLGNVKDAADGMLAEYVEAQKINADHAWEFESFAEFAALRNAMMHT